MKKILLFVLLFNLYSLSYGKNMATNSGKIISGQTTESSEKVENKKSLKKYETLNITVVGQGVAPKNSISPAQSAVMAKRAAIADAYRLIAEKIKGVHVDGEDVVKNMMLKSSTVKTSVNAMVKNAKIVETKYKDGLCEVEMAITLSYSQFSH